MSDITYGSVCSGIEAATVAWHNLGWKPAWFSEIAPFPSAVLAHHYPDVENLGDMTRLDGLLDIGDIAAPAVLVGGTPCQAFSVAGLRNGLSDHRGQLTLSFVELANAIDRRRQDRGEQPCVIVWENVPGVFSSKDNAFGCFLAGLAGEDEPLIPSGKKWTNAGAVYGPQRTVAWRVLDAQYFGVAQRRRRVFVIASARDGFDPSKILFEFDGLRRDSAPRRESGEDTTRNSARSVAIRGRGGIPQCELGDTVANTILTPNGGRGGIGVGAVLASSTGSISHCLNAGGMGRIDYETETMVVHATQDPCCSSSVAFTLGRNNGQENAIAFAQNTRDEVRLMNGDGQIVGALAAEPGMKQTCYVAQPAIGWSEELTAHVDLGATLQRGGQGGRHDGVMTPSMRVRRLTPVECARLQGFPDTYLDILYRKKPAADGNKYKALGNSMAVPVMAWIGSRINAALQQ